MNWLYAFSIAIILVSIGAISLNISSEKRAYSVEQALNNYQELKGQPIILKGEIVQGQSLCTKIYCGPENPCCNTCSAPLELKNGTEILLTGDEIGCSGNSCSLNCTPIAGKIYRVEGEIQNQNGRKSFQVSDYREVAVDS